MTCLCLIHLKPWAPRRSGQRLWVAYLYPFPVFPFFFGSLLIESPCTQLKNYHVLASREARRPMGCKECRWIPGKPLNRANSALKCTIFVLAHSLLPGKRAWWGMMLQWPRCNLEWVWGWELSVKDGQTKRWGEPGWLITVGPLWSSGLPTYGLLLHEPKSKPLSCLNSSYLSLCESLFRRDTEAFWPVFCRWWSGSQGSSVAPFLPNEFWEKV